MTGNKPEYAMAAGLARVVTSEQASLNLATLDLDLDSTSVEQIANIIAATVKEQGDKGFADENETYVANDLAYISRLMPNNQINEVCSREEQELTNAAFHPEACLVGDVQAGKVFFEVN